MCDTQVLIRDGVTWFAKNSDREAGEPQPVVRLAPVRGDASTRLRTTYLEIEQAPDRHGVLLSKPSWIWGAEMGANDRGVVIGNEAIFSRVVERRPALLGMDLVRLGLERGGSAREALEVVTGLLERHGQGGPAGYRDKTFCYDNSFLIADAAEAWVLETAARHWVAKRVEREWAISNCLTIGSNFEIHSDGLHEFARSRNLWNGKGDLDFARTFDGRWMPRLARAHERVASGRACLAEAASAGPSLARFANGLRRHAGGNEDPMAGSNADLCMHAAGPLRPSQTTGSMISRLAVGDARHVLTGTSAPCLSLFRPVSLEAETSFSVLTPGDGSGDAVWRRFEGVYRRALFDASLREGLRALRNECESRVFACLSGGPPGAGELTRADQAAIDWEHRALSLARPRPLRAPWTPAGLFWRRRNRIDGIA